MSDQSHAIALISGGLDSCVVAAIAALSHQLSFLHVTYGQRTHGREQVGFTRIADHFGLRNGVSWMLLTCAMSVAQV